LSEKRVFLLKNWGGQAQIIPEPCKVQDSLALHAVRGGM
jgi:hypothetical protein